MMNQQSENKATNTPKSRHLPILEYYEILQMEYLNAELRKKIYSRLKDKNYWAKVMDGKKETIIKLAEKNSLPSIFSDDTMLREFQKKLYKDIGAPNFIYKDEKNRQEQEYWDLIYYFAKSSDVRVEVNGEMKTGKITKEFIPYKDFNVTVTIEGEEKTYSISIVTRIL